MACGKTFCAAAEASGVRWAEVSYWIHQEQKVSQTCRPFNDLYELAKSCQSAVLQHQREDALHKRGVDGWEEPIIWKGIEVGTIHRYSDKCLEIALKGENPDKYSDRHQAAVNLDVAIVFQEFGVPPSEPQRPTIDVTGQLRVEPRNPGPNPGPRAGEGQNPNE